MASDQMPRVSVRLPAEQLDDLEALATYRDLTGPDPVDRSKVLRELINEGLDERDDEISSAHAAIDEVAE